MYGLKKDWVPEQRPRYHCLEDYEGKVPRWCPGCGDHAVLSALQRYCRDAQLDPEKIVTVSGIGCSSRFPHYMKTYGFHGLHGRCLPVACGVKSRRPDLTVFAVTGDGDCCAIGTAHWIHAIRYNMDITVLLLDNNIYGLTKMQTSPTTEKEQYSNTHPRGAILSALNPLTVTLGITNASFVAQTVDWNPPHVAATIAAGHQHKGLSFIRIIQRCPHYLDKYFDWLQSQPEMVRYLKHEDGIQIPDQVLRSFPNQQEHDPSDLGAAFKWARDTENIPVGLLYRNPDAERYDIASAHGIDWGVEQRLDAANAVLDRFAI